MANLTESSAELSAAPVRAAPDGTQGAGGGARERILEAAYELFSQNGIGAVGIDAVISRSGVARQTLYRQFGSKQALVLAFLERRDEVWTQTWLQGEVKRRAEQPAERLLTIFDVFDEWFRLPDFEGCSFINVMLEHTDRSDPINQSSISYLADIRGFISGLALEAGVAEPATVLRRAGHSCPSGGGRCLRGRAQRRSARASAALMVPYPVPVPSEPAPQPLSGVRAASAEAADEILSRRLWCVVEVCVEVPQQRWERRLVICYESGADVADALAEYAGSVPEYDIRLNGCSRTDLRLDSGAPAHLCYLAEAEPLASWPVIPG
ncbi:MAG: TetR/AcrR family transcriptional regulator [Thermoleophilia bacterium]|nr:TetR/AcrR family transcriptional regulator [Thermoleophilia bacterium]